MTELDVHRVGNRRGGGGSKGGEEDGHEGVQRTDVPLLLVLVNQAIVVDAVLGAARVRLELRLPGHIQRGCKPPPRCDGVGVLNLQEAGDQLR